MESHIWSSSETGRDAQLDARGDPRDHQDLLSANYVLGTVTHSRKRKERDAWVLLASIWRGQVRQSYRTDSQTQLAICMKVCYFLMSLAAALGL